MGDRNATVSFSPEKRQKKEQLINSTLRDLSRKIEARGDFELTPERQAVLRLKLARHFSRTDEIDPSTLFDALVETPKFIDDERGSLVRLIEIHQQKTLERIAEARKKRAELGDKEAFNPWENLFTTISGNYYMARLLNMPHLEMESDYMKHCVGTGTHGSHYLRKIQSGDIEILSFRNVPKINQETQKLEGDTPIITIEYNLRTKTIEQMKKQNDKYLSLDDPYYKDVIDALKQLRGTQTDSGKLRDFVKIQPSELENIKVRDGYVLTEDGEVSLRAFNPDSGVFIFKLGKMSIEANTSRRDVAKIIRLTKGIKVSPDEIALDYKQVGAKTKVYIGKPVPEIYTKDFFTKVPYVYTESSLENQTTYEYVIAGGENGREYEGLIEQKGDYLSDYAKSMLENRDFVTLSKPERIDLIRTTVGGLGLTKNITTDQLYKRAQELGLELCPPEVGPELRLKYQDQPLYEWIYIGMEPIIASDGHPHVFELYHDDGDPWLNSCWTDPGPRWNLDNGLVFRLCK